MKSLYRLIWEAKHENGQEKLTETQIDFLVEMFGSGCRSTTKERLRRRLSLPLSLFRSFGIFDRLMIGETDIDYIIGQDFVSERKTVRQCLLDQ